MTTEVGREHVEPARPALLRELPVTLAVGRDAVQADDRRRVLLAPLEDVQLHRGDDTAAVELEVREGDIAAVEADALANAANDHLWMGAGVAGALKRVGGEEIEREAVAKRPIPLGSAVATTAGRLGARYVIHGAAMGQDLATDAGLISRTTRSCLALADELGCRSLALPAFGTGVGGFAVATCAGLMVAEARAFEPRVLERVIFAVFGSTAYEAFSSALSSPFPDGR